MQVVVMCKAPVEGKVKTRLMTHYSAAEAKAWHEAMATTVVARAQRVFSDVYVAVDDVTHPFFAAWDVPLLPQGAGDLGERMVRVMRGLGEGSLMFLGTDSPHMQEQRLREAERSVQEVDVVLGAVEDGGYDLIAMRTPDAAMFSDIDWGSARVLQQSVARAASLGLSYRVLDASFDVDTPDMLARAWAEGWQPDGLALSGQSHRPLSS